MGCRRFGGMWHGFRWSVAKGDVFRGGDEGPRHPYLGRYGTLARNPRPRDVGYAKRCRLSFPNNFLWGVATSGYQIEGAPDADGKGPSIWDRFTHLPGKILHGDTGDHACNTYDPQRLAGDLDLLAALGAKAYIFSVQWPRIQPDGRGPANAKGLDYYRRLVDGLCQRGIVPVLTLYHWELPQALQDRGGWLERDTVERFVDYAAILHRALGPQVPWWVTQNEPHTSAWLGYGSGRHAPGLTGELNALTAAHHLLLAHGRVIQALGTTEGEKKTRFGAVIAISPVRPDRPDHPPDVAAAARVDGEQNRLFLDPIFRRRIPGGCPRALPRVDARLRLRATRRPRRDPYAVRFSGRQLLQPLRSSPPDRATA